ncbi:MAG TPA: LytTR family DNA-binding domain-containing protein [Ferruginibacter sp.]|jgi:DNA-binding LytR/AlgR family response regulator|nr:response regulator transcription factor [Ferruginibacter sp.]MBN8698768.1 response regulator transcription factor [Chitinophagales bacterium]HMZ99948.1 LytTR family DNA-binding domain-containing protein [Ferruginibacter sp.]HNF03397.1 LytTR family DNA-binding domain-containing protein [Ferruginibacter sp.]HNG63053.1 LytTR family DNA-binding domain-containing protein [Ferruginibacter sp.]
MKILIVEDEQLAQERLQLLIRAYDPSIEIIGCLESVEDTIHWLNTRSHPDLILLDIHLSDGECFEIFKQAKTQKPVIFITAYENFAIDAFRVFSIDYILKPVTASALAAALNKYKQLADVFIPRDYQLLAEQVKENNGNSYRQRFLAKVGQRLFFIPADEVAYFSADNKIVYLIDREGNRFVINTTMEKLESELNPRDFFRLNRKIIIHAGVIDQVKPYPNNRLKLQLRGVSAAEEMIISRERVNDFKQWADA